MKKKNIRILICAMMLTIGLTGCVPSTHKMPDGDVKLSNQQVIGVVDLLLQSANYGKDKSTVVSMLLPEGSAYDITMSIETYLGGQLAETKEIQKHSTAILAKDDIAHIILNVGKNSTENVESKSIYSIAEVDKEKTKDLKQPEYKVTNITSEAINYDSKTEITVLGTDLNKEIPVVALVKFKDEDVERKSIDLENYTSEVGNYKEVNIIKVRADKK